MIFLRIKHIEWRQILHCAANILFFSKVLVRFYFENTMFSAPEEGLADFPIFFTEGVMHDSNPALVVDSKANQNSHG